MAYSLAVVVIGYAPVLYTVEEVDSTGEVDVTIRLLQGDLTGLTASTAIPIDVSAASFTATGLYLSDTCQCFSHLFPSFRIAISRGEMLPFALHLPFPHTHTHMPLLYHHK